MKRLRAVLLTVLVTQVSFACGKALTQTAERGFPSPRDPSLSSDNMLPHPTGHWREVLTGRSLGKQWHVLVAPASDGGICQAAFTGDSDTEVNAVSGAGEGHGAVVHEGHVASCLPKSVSDGDRSDWIHGTKYLRLSDDFGASEALGLLVGTYTAGTEITKFTGRADSSYSVQMSETSFTLVFPLVAEPSGVLVTNGGRSRSCKLPDGASGVAIIC